MARKRRLKKLAKKLSGLAKTVSRLESRMRTTPHRPTPSAKKRASPQRATSSRGAPQKRAVGRAANRPKATTPRRRTKAHA